MPDITTIPIRATSIKVALPSDGNYFDGLLTTTMSIVQSCNETRNIDFFILDGGISKGQWDFLRDRFNSDNRITFSQLIVDKESLSKFPSHLGLGSMTSSRLLLPVLLPDECDFIIYSDTDIIWNTDISQLWDMRSDDIIFQSVADTTKITLQREERWFASHGFCFNQSRYFCAGISFFNLKAFRKEGILEQALEFINKHKEDLQYADQTTLNVLFAQRNDIALLSHKWQTLSIEIPPDNACKDIVIHFAGDAPWKVLRSHLVLNNIYLNWFKTYATARGLSLWKSLTTFYPAWIIVIARISYLILSGSAIARIISRHILHVLGRNDSLIQRASFSAP